MNGIRRRIAFILGMMCLILAIVAIYQTYPEAGSAADSVSDGARWGRNLEAAARRCDKLVFVYRKGERFPPDVMRVLKQNYICAEFDRRMWPADGEIFDAMICGRARASMAFGIFTPRLAPLFLSADKTVVLNGEEVDLAALLDRTAHFYYLDRRAAYAAGMRTYRENFPFKLPVKLEPSNRARGGAGKIESERASSALNGGRLGEFPPAALTETLRLGVHLYKETPTPLLAEGLEKAADEAVRRLDAEPELAGRLLLARALAEYAAVFPGASVSEKLRRLGDNLLVCQRSDGFFQTGADAPGILENCLAVAFLTRAENLTRAEKTLKGRKFLLAALKAAAALKNTLYAASELPAVADLSLQSQASSYEYAFMANAFADIFAETADGEFLKAAKFALDEWGENFMTPHGVWSVNSRNSQFGAYARSVISEDLRLPSYIGEGLQAINKLRRLDSSFDASAYAGPRRYEDLPETAKGPGDAPVHSSIRLSVFE